MPEPEGILRGGLPPATLPPDPARVELLARVLGGAAEHPGQVLALLQSDAGLCRACWDEMRAAHAAEWQGLHEMAMARPREDLRRWLLDLRRNPALGDPSAGEPAALERERLNRLRRALVGRQVFAAGWAAFDPGTDTDRAALGVRSIFERYLLVLAERIFLTNLGVLGFDRWFRPPVEAVVGLDMARLREALEQRWAATVGFFPALDASATAWTAAHAAAGDLFPTLDAIEAAVLQVLRTAGLREVAPTRLQSKANE
ncbi:MAG: hypothetical protein ACREJ2_04400 [Planctomycetota bacterium]